MKKSPGFIYCQCRSSLTPEPTSRVPYSHWFSPKLVLWFIVFIHSHHSSVIATPCHFYLLKYYLSVKLQLTCHLQRSTLQSPSPSSSQGVLSSLNSYSIFMPLINYSHLQLIKTVCFLRIDSIQFLVPRVHWPALRNIWMVGKQV